MGASKPEWPDPYGDAPRLKLREREVPMQLVRPTSYMERWDVVSALNVNTNRAYIAALGLSCPPLRRLLSEGRVHYRGDALEYGGKVADYLLDQGAQFGELLAHGVAAVNLCITDLVGETEVKEAEGNS
jgi:hypothetical protein